MIKFSKVKDLLIYTAPVVMILVLCNHLYLVHSHHLSNWMGGGFGMFSSSDRLQYRIVRCFLTSERGDRPVKVPRSLRRFSSLAKSMPTRDNLLNLAQRLNKKSYYKKSSYADGIRVEVFMDIPI